MTTLTDRCDEAMARAMFILDTPDLARSWDRAIADPTSRQMICAEWLRQARAARLALLSELDAAGWQIVPRDATREMVTAAIDRPDAPDPITPLYEPVYAAMRAAAPKPFGEGEE